MPNYDFNCVKRLKPGSKLRQISGYKYNVERSTTRISKYYNAPPYFDVLLFNINQDFTYCIYRMSTFTNQFEVLRATIYVQIQIHLHLGFNINILILDLHFPL